MRKYNYVYKISTTNPIDERKYYIGVRSCNCLPEKDIGYWSSSKYLKEAIDEIGLENFFKEILSVWETREKAVEEEIRLHKKFDVGKNNEYFNKSRQRSVGFDWDATGHKFSESFKQKIKRRQTGKNNSFYGKHHSEESIKKIREKTTGTNNHFFGKSHSEETRKIISAKSGVSKGTKYMYNLKLELTKRIKKKDIQSYLDRGWCIGRKIFKKT